MIVKFEKKNPCAFPGPRVQNFLIAYFGTIRLKVDQKALNFVSTLVNITHGFMYVLKNYNNVSNTWHVELSKKNYELPTLGNQF